MSAFAPFTAMPIVMCVVQEIDSRCFWHRRATLAAREFQLRPVECTACFFNLFLPAFLSPPTIFDTFATPSLPICERQCCAP